MNDGSGSASRPLEGYFFEDFAPGRRFVHATARTLTAGDASLYIALTGARQPLHCSEPLARAMGHRACPIDDLLVFNVAFGKTVADISYNAVANLGYADVRFLAPVYAGDTLACESEVIGAKENTNGKTGVVYVRSEATNQEGVAVLSWIRWVMVRKRSPAATSIASVPELPSQVPAASVRVPQWLTARALTARVTGSTRAWEDYAPGATIDHPGGMTVEEADHMLATRLYQNTARIHFDAHAARRNAFGKRLVYGGHVISILRALAYDGLENVLAIAAIHGGAHVNPTFAGETLRCRHVVVARDELPGRSDLGLLRLRMIGAKDVELAELPAIAPGEKSPCVVLDLDYSVVIARRQSA
jgi:2-methylfumaryl-CoA hydratase